MIVSVPLTLPGLVNSINPNIHVGVGTRLFDIAYMLGVSATFIFRRLEMVLNLNTQVYIGIDCILHFFQTIPCQRYDA